MSTSPTYWIYILRFWPEPNGDEPAANRWRFTLEEPTTRARRGFASLAELAAFLGDETKQIPILAKETVEDNDEIAAND